MRDVEGTEGRGVGRLWRLGPFQGCLGQWGNHKAKVCKAEEWQSPWVLRKESKGWQRSWPGAPLVGILSGPSRVWHPFPITSGVTLYQKSEPRHTQQLYTEISQPSECPLSIPPLNDPTFSSLFFETTFSCTTFCTVKSVECFTFRRLWSTSIFPTKIFLPPLNM